ncbi:protein D2-like [Panulirus ornatus]|uniref:protein D2-like n=1 Tax=Panulirus ornatus TaxID=150431 RepID=UPI003A84EA8A
MEEHKVVPDVLEAPPPELLQVRYGEAEVASGRVLTPTQVVAPPTHLAWTVEEEALYTLCMTDPDAPSPLEPKFREVMHWLVVNIPGCDVARGDILTHFVGSGPPKGTGLHRYVYLVYKQPTRLTCDEPVIPNTQADGRKYFSIKNFAAKYKLQLVAGNFYRAEYDSTCDVLHRQLGLRY